MQKTIENQVQQSFTDTINRMHEGYSNDTTAVDSDSAKENSK
ncbi:hypothetical protein [Candidatus Nitrosocosmicus franklandus]|nr:hypothetical protein [Candidatus Nitrosocosmicus franklandus]